MEIYFVIPRVYTVRCTGRVRHSAHEGGQFWERSTGSWNRITETTWNYETAIEIDIDWLKSIEWAGDS